MQVKSEPAGRLYDILSAARECNENEKSRDVWAKVFEVDPADTGELLKMLAELIDLVAETKAALGRLEDIDHKVYLRPFKQIEAALSQTNLDANWKPWRNRLDEPTLYGLQFASDKLSRVMGYTEISAEDIVKIHEELDGLTKSVLDSELNEDLKTFLIRNLEGLRQALIAYRIRGVDGLEQEVARNLGSILLHKDQIQAAPDQKPVWDRYSRFLDSVNKTVSTAKSAKSLLPPVLKLIGME